MLGAGVWRNFVVVLGLWRVLSAMKAGSSYSATEGKRALMAGKWRGVMVLEQTAPLTA